MALGVLAQYITIYTLCIRLLCHFIAWMFAGTRVFVVVKYRSCWIVKGSGRTERFIIILRGAWCAPRFCRGRARTAYLPQALTHYNTTLIKGKYKQIITFLPYSFIYFEQSNIPLNSQKHVSNDQMLTEFHRKRTERKFITWVSSENMR